MKNKKRTIFISALLILLCVVLCVGTTLAFFTDAVVSKTNKVQAGELKVDLELLTKGTENDWGSIKANNEPIFDYTLWEKGYTDVKILRVENEGDLAIEWKAVYGSQEEVSELAQAIDVYFKTSDEPFSYPTKREELANWNTWQGTLDQFINNISTYLAGELEGGKSTYFGIALQMQKDADDDKYGLTLGEFDIHIVAKQLTSEEDFFGTDYDENAEFPCMHVNTYINVVEGATPAVYSEATETEPATEIEPAKVGKQQTVCDDCGAVLSEEDCYFVVECITDYNNGNCYSVAGVVEGHAENIIIPDRYNNIPLESIRAFAGNTKITSVKIPNGVKRIEDSAFYNCSNLINVEIPDSVSFIGPNSFKECKNLVSIKIPQGIKTINADAFYGCRSLTNVELPDSVTVIGFRAFEYCTSLTSIKLPPSLVSFSQYAFYGSGLISIDIPDSVTKIALGTFQECKNLASVKLPNNLTTIETYTFYNCRALTSVTIPNSVTSIGQGVFSGCSSLMSINIPDGVTSIGGSAFSGCKSLLSIEFPGQITVINGGTFSGCSSLMAFEIPDGVTSIGASAFNGCSNLLNIEIPDGVTSVGDSLFRNCDALSSIVFPKGVTSIGDSTFWGCDALTSVTFLGEVTSIGNQAFQSCPKISTITLPDSVTSIGSSAFYDCSSFTTLNFTGTVEQWNSITFGTTWDYNTNKNFVVVCQNGTISKDGIVTMNQ